MQKQVKVTDIYCLLKGSYDGTFEKLKTVDDIFTPRNVRGNLLVWDLPGEGWIPLSNADSVMSAMVKSEIYKRKQSVINTFGVDKAAYAEKCFTVPDDGCIYFKTDEQTGILKIRLTAWGYMTPVRPNGNDLIGGAIPEKETANLHFSYGGEPMRNKQFSILRPDGGTNTFTTDGNGDFNFFGQPIKTGEPVRIEVDGKQFMVTIEKGKNDYPIDLTKTATVTVKVFLDGNPKQGAEITAGTTKSLTDENGTAKFETVIPQNGSLTVYVRGEYTNGNDTKTITEGENLFSFDFSSPKVEQPLIDPPAENKEEPKQEEEPETMDEPVKEEEPPYKIDEPVVDENPITEDQPQNEEDNQQATQSNPEIIGIQTPHQVPRQGTENDSGVWQKVLMILGLVALIAGTYYVCFQILN